MTQDLITTNIAVARSAEEVAREFHLPWIWKYDLEDEQRAEVEYPGIYPTLRTASAAVRYYLHGFAHNGIEGSPVRDSCNGSSNLCVNLPDAIDFLHSDYMAGLAIFLNKGSRAPTEDEINLTARSILNHPHQEGIDPKMLFMDYIDIIRDLRPSAAVLDCVRKCLRNTAVFAPTPAEFRTALIQATKTIDRLINDINLLATKPQEGLRNIEERITFLIENSHDHELINDLHNVLTVCYNNLDSQQQLTRDSNGRQDAIEHFSEDARD